jgi:hypothetical protein
MKRPWTGDEPDGYHISHGGLPPASPIPANKRPRLKAEPEAELSLADTPKSNNPSSPLPSPLPSPLITSRTETTLSSLPTEILCIILDFSLEPSLIHTSRRFYYSLPSYVPFTKTLAVKALLPHNHSGNPRVKRQSYPKFDDDLQALEDLRFPVSQAEIRSAVFSSSWFNEAHLRQVHARLFHSNVLKLSVWHSVDGPSRGQARRIKAFIDQKPEYSPMEQLNLRLRDAKGRPLNMIATPLNISLSAQHTTSVFSPVTFSVLDFAGVVPDHLLRKPLTTSKLKLIQHIADAVSRGRCGATNVTCNLHLLREAFIDSIVQDKALAFFALFTLEALLDPTKGVIVDFLHLEWAVIKGRSRMLIAIIKRLWAYPRQYRPSDADILDLINRAKAHAYPEWPKTTRILAMEVAW